MRILGSNFFVFLIIFLRQKEAEELRERMEREKRELQEFIGEFFMSGF